MQVIKVPIEKVQPWEKNPRGIKAKDYDRLKKQILKLGVYKPLLTVKENGGYTVLGGNMRIRALKELGIKEVDVSVVKAPTEAKKIEYALSDNDRVGFYEEDKLAELVYPHLAEIELHDFKVDLGEPIDLKGVVERYGPDIDDGADDVPEVDDTPAVTKTGDLFTLGRHRLLCGDSTKPEDVARLMKGEKAALFATDPPYGCNAGNIGFTAERDDIEAITKDDLEGKEMQAFLERTFAAWLPYLQDNAAWYLWHPMLTQGYFAAAAAAADLIIHRQIIWRKEQFIFGRGDYHWRHELCFYGWRKGNHPEWRGGRNQDTVWDIPWGEKRSEVGHPTAKPTALFEIPMKNHLEDGGLCAEPFAGSGSQIIAAEKTGRTCYGMEIDPKYCDVIIRRYADYTKTPEDTIRATREAI